MGIALSKALEIDKLTVEGKSIRDISKQIGLSVGYISEYQRGLIKIEEEVRVNGVHKTTPKCSQRSQQDGFMSVHDVHKVMNTTVKEIKSYVEEQFNNLKREYEPIDKYELIKEIKKQLNDLLHNKLREVWAYIYDLERKNKLNSSH